jgi:type VI secretion system protein ImpB
MAGIQSKHKRLRKPKVHIKYEIETEGRWVEKEPPVVAAVMGDVSAPSAEPLKPVHDPKFIQIDRDNFDEAPAQITPGRELRAPNALADNGTEIPIGLKFAKMDDFEPATIIAQVPALKSLMETRNQLRDLLSKADRCEGLESLLERVLHDKADLKQLAEELKLQPEELHSSPSSDGAH